MKRPPAFSVLTVATAALALAGAGCAATRTELPRAELQSPRLLPRAAHEGGPGDLTPVTWLKAPTHPPVELVRDGRPKAVVYVADPAGRGNFDPHDYRYENSSFPPALMRLVHELIEVVRLGSGAALERVDRPPPAGQPAIVIGDCAETRRAGIDAARLPVEGFVVKTAPKRVYLVGSTQALPAGGTGKNDGTAWAVADFLERLVGVRWYWPAEYGGRSIPRSSSLVISPAHYRDQPVFRERTFHPEQNKMLPLSFAPHYATPRNLMSLPVHFVPGVLPDGETFVTLVPHLALMRYGSSLAYRPVQQGARAHEVAGAAARTEPRREAMFALKQDGSRNYGVFCYSAPETLDYLLGCCERAWDKGGHGGMCVTPSGINIWFPFTPGLACDCPGCRATAAKFRDDRELSAGLAARHGDRRAYEIVEQLVHERVFGLFAQRLCEAVKQRWPDKKVVYHPWHTDCPAGVEFPDNLVVHDLDSGYRMGLMHQPVVRRKQQDRLRAWCGSAEASPASAAADAGAASRRIVGWRCGFYGPSDWTYGPVQFPHVVQDFYLANRDVISGSQVLTYSLPCWTTAAPTWYVWMRVLWNPELDVDAVLDEMCRRLFGAGADAARALLRLECERWEGATWTRPLLQEAMLAVGEGSFRFPDDFHFRQSWPADVVARMAALRDKALAEMADDPRARQAFFYWTWTFDEFLKAAEAIYGTDTAGVEAGPPAQGTNAVRRPGGGGSIPTALPPATQTNAIDGAEMVLIPAGEFRMGTSAADHATWLEAYPRDWGDLLKFTAEGCQFFRQFLDGADEEQRALWLSEQPGRRDDLFKSGDEMPRHEVGLDAYYMYKTEVTVAQYRRFCEATGRAMPPQPASSGFRTWKWQDTHPIVNVAWQDAAAYADWAGAALPTEAEWEKAARGGDRRVFPWGDAWPPPEGAGNFADVTFRDLRMRSRFFLDGYTDGFAFTAPAGTFAANPYGLHDMAGNVREWCADWYGPAYYKQASPRNPAGPATGVWRVVRGGDWHSATPWGFRAAARGDYIHLPVGTSSCVVGFRCVVRAP